MIPTERLLYKIDWKLNKVGSGNHQNIPLPDKILALNEAQIRLVKKKVNINNLYQVGFDGMRTRYQDLQNLVVPYEELQVTKTKEVYSSYQADIEKLKQKYYMPVEVIVVGSKGDCKERALNVPRLTKHSDISTTLNNTHLQPSFKFQETVAVVSSNNLIIYANDPEGEFKVDKVLVSYLRYPKSIDFEGYVGFDGKSSQTVNCELPDYLEDELLSLAVAELANITGNQYSAQTQMSMSQNSE